MEMSAHPRHAGIPRLSFKGKVHDSLVWDRRKLEEVPDEHELNPSEGEVVLPGTTSDVLELVEEPAVDL